MKAMLSRRTAKVKLSADRSNPGKPSAGWTSCGNHRQSDQRAERQGYGSDGSWGQHRYVSARDMTMGVSKHYWPYLPLLTDFNAAEAVVDATHRYKQIFYE